MPTTRPHRTLVRSTRIAPEEERARLEQRARLCGLAPARYLGEAALGVEPKVRAGAIERQLLSQPARAANALRRVELSARLERTLSALAFERMVG
jgi:Mobilization protein NikA